MLGNTRVIDAHCHTYPEKIAEKAAAGTDAFYGTVAAHRGTPEELLKLDPRIDLFVVESVATTPRQVRSINGFLAETAASSPRLSALGALHPDSPDQAGDMEHLLSLGLKGVKLHPDIQRFAVDDPRCLKIYELCGKAGIPVLLHTGDKRYDYSNPNRLLPVLRAYPHVTFIGAHFGGYSVWESAVPRLSGTENLYVDLCSSMQWITPEETLSYIRAYGADRVLFGTDYPMWDPATCLDAFLALGLEGEDLELICHKNAEKVFGLEAL
ncbi:MAG: amidohydrolase [Clostridia bacterium]|nr:amidohydrolase [Clostridia bacterium]